MSLEPKMGDPDWGRYLMKPGATPPVGDATRWGAEVNTLIDVSMIRFSDQIINIATRDEYSRSWSVLGSLTLPSVTWGSLDMLVALEITMGVGQVKIVQQIALYAADAVTPRGLCISQLLPNGGPYPTLVEGANEKRSFAIVGGLVGQSIQIRAMYSTANALLTLGMPATPKIALIATPYAAGQGL